MSAERHPVRPHFLLVGDSTDLPAIRRMLERLPVAAYGQVFVEIASRVQIQRFEVPEGVSLTWLLRDGVGDGAARRMAPRGECVVRAVHAWFDEWMFEGGQQAPRVVWIGCSASPRVSRLHRELRARFPLLGGDDRHAPVRGA
ncbi:SIP domain-containing protein [Microbacterium betulae]|uniref:SIP domain-containing protein n=1 Tax=Microbacterium betulae TaxID=2981139 RepID=A0AA97I703_9MICO|nr:SIP domain-containing protein [Microbacterium sp. AB]WOF23712.1 SIP domain-containing protein [Microbacterium sp. AB]